VDGQNMLPVWTRKAKAPERTLFWEWRVEGYNQVAAMRGDLKLVITGNTTPELYNVVTDPSERRTLFQEHPQLGRELRQATLDWLATETEAAKWGKPTRVTGKRDVPCLETLFFPSPQPSPLVPLSHRMGEGLGVRATGEWGEAPLVFSVSWCGGNERRFSAAARCGSVH